LLICTFGVASTIYLYSGLFKEASKYKDSEEYQKFSEELREPMKHFKESCGVIYGNTLLLSIDLVHVQSQNYLFVRSFREGSKWGEFGFQKDDVITHINGIELSKPPAVGRLEVAAAACKDESKFIIMRSGNRYTLSHSK